MVIGLLLYAGILFANLQVYNFQRLISNGHLFRILNIQTAA